MPANPNTTEPQKPRRRWFQFRLEGLFVILVVLAACVGEFYWVTRPTHDDEKRAKASEKIKALGDALTKHEEAMKTHDDALEQSNKHFQKVFEKATEK